MCSGKTYVSNAASAAAPYQVQGALETTKAGMGNLFQYGVPETYTPDLQTINQQLRTQTELSDLINKEYERQSNPELFALRESLGAKTADVFNPDTAVTNELLKRGLISAKNTLGAAGNTGTGSTANQVMQKIYGPAYQQYKQQLFNDQNAYLDQNRRKAVMLDPSTAVSMTEGAKIGRVDAANMRKNQLLTGTSNASSTLQNYYSGLMNNIIGESGNNANAKTAASQQGANRMFSLMTLPFQAATTAAKFV